MKLYTVNYSITYVNGEVLHGSLTLFAGSSEAIKKIAMRNVLTKNDPTIENACRIMLDVKDDGDERI